MEDIDPESVKKAREYRPRRKPLWITIAAVAACAAILVGVVWGVPALQDRGRHGGEDFAPGGLRTVAAVYPEPVAQGLDPQKFMESNAHWEWRRSYRESVSGTEGLQADTDPYTAALISQILVSEDENTVCSPLNTYIAFAMLAEVSGGNTRQQILDMLGAADVKTLRENVSALWENNWADTPVLRSVLANSLWLDGRTEYDGDTLETLAEQYHASSFMGTPGSEEMDEALRAWTDDSTGGLLDEYTRNMSLDPGTVMEIVSTICYRAMWVDDFREEDTTREVFHGTAGDTEAEMMHKTGMMAVYRGAGFTSLRLDLMDSGAMYFLLPDEGTDVNNILTDPDILRSIRGDGSQEDGSFPLVHLSVPKFRVSGSTDLLEAARALGLTDAMDPALADFTPLVPAEEGTYLSRADHAAVIEIDEQGVTGAAYTDLALTGGAADPDDEMDFILDRPFVFLVTGLDGSVLFAGAVRNIG